ncbi:uncharacterized protein [Prorops nasuta]|uniref:uncharacterized protein isoform X2 n=1 Tax=Prorops nasuta TaxID=863751 RepID=UPI0034CDABD3
MNLCWMDMWQESLKTIKALKELFYKKPSKDSPGFEVPLSFMELQKYSNLIDTDQDYTPKCYDEHHAWEVFEYTIDTNVLNTWRKLVELPEKEQTMERYGLLVFQVNTELEYALWYEYWKHLDYLAEETKNRLQELWPNHPIFATSKEKLKLWRKNIISNNQWDSDNSRKMLNALCYTMFKSLCVSGVSKMDYKVGVDFTGYDLKDEYSDPLCLAILFEGVSRRVGIRCCGIMCGKRFFLKWKECYESKSDSDIFYVDFFNGGRFLRKNNSSTNEITIGEYPVISEQERIARCLRAAAKMRMDLTNEIQCFTIINCNAAQLKPILEDLNYLEMPQAAENILELAKFYVNARIIYCLIERLIKEATNDADDKKLGYLYESLDNFRQSVYLVEEPLFNFDMYNY